MRSLLPKQEATLNRTAILLCLVACAEPEVAGRQVVEVGDVAIPSHEAFSPRQLHASTFTMDSSLGKPETMVWSGGLLWVVDYAGAPWLHAFDPVSGARVWSGGERGDGPGQFSSIGSIAANPQTGGVWLFDGGFRFTAMDTSVRMGTTPRVVTHQERSRINRAIAIAGERYFGLQMVGRDSSRIVVLDQDGKVAIEMPWPLLGSDSVPAESRILASGASLGVVLCPKPDGRRVAITYTAAGKIDLFDDAGRLVNSANVPFPTDAVFRKVADGRLRPSRPRYWYSGCTAGRGRLYALFSGKREADYPPPYYGSGEFVHVFDWDGALLEVLALDRPLGAIAVDSTEHTLFGVPIGEAEIVRFDLRAVD